MRMRLSLLLGAAAVPFLLGAFSVAPFSRLYLPVLLLNQWRRAHFPALPNAACVSAARESGVIFEQTVLPDFQSAAGCAIDTPLIISAGLLPYQNIALDPQEQKVTLSCSFAQQLEQFVAAVILPEAIKQFGRTPKRLLHKGGFSCRPQASSLYLLSSHAFAEAFDFAGIDFEDGMTVLVEKDFGTPTPAGRFLQRVAAEACREFGTALGPAFDEHHRDHLHIALGFPYRCKY